MLLMNTVPLPLVAVHMFGPQHAAWLESWQLPADARVIAIAGPLVRRAAADEAIWCFELVRVLYPEARLLVLGDGPDRARLERFADEVSEPGCVRFLGYRADIAEILPHADVYWQLTSSTAAPGRPPSTARGPPAWRSR